MKIALIGFMGSGKTEVGSLLARKLGKNYIEMDFLVLQKSEEISINEIFRKHGEPHFRALEISVSEDLVHEKNAVIATGGGVVLNKSIIDNLKEEDGRIVYLHASFENICKRLEGDTTRPLFTDKNKANELYEIRKPLYESYADITIKTESKTIEEVTNEIIDSLKR